MRSMECNDSGGAAAKKSKKAERTGATHLIHGGAMQGRKTAVSISQFLSSLNSSITTTCVFWTRCTILPILATPSPGAKSRHGTSLRRIPLLFGLQRISKSFGLASTPNIGKRSMLECGSVRIAGLSSGVSWSINSRSVFIKIAETSGPPSHSMRGVSKVANTTSLTYTPSLGESLLVFTCAIDTDSQQICARRYCDRPQWYSVSLCCRMAPCPSSRVLGQKEFNAWSNLPRLFLSKEVVSYPGK